MLCASMRHFWLRGHCHTGEDSHASSQFGTMSRTTSRPRAAAAGAGLVDLPTAGPALRMAEGCE